MVTFDLLPDDEPVYEKEPVGEKESVVVDSKLRKVEQIQSDRNATRASRKQGVKLLAEIIAQSELDTIVGQKVFPALVKLLCRLFHDDSGMYIEREMIR